MFSLLTLAKMGAVKLEWLYKSPQDAIEEIPAPPRWPESPACLDADPETFFPRRGQSTARAKEICAGCSARERCLSWALAVESEDESSWGVFGGLSGPERKALRAARGHQRSEKPERECANCGVAGAGSKGLCRACYAYYLRTGRPRPLALIVDTWERKEMRRLHRTMAS